MNLKHIFKLQGLLKLCGILCAFVAAAIATSAFLNSGYNQSCRNSEPLPPTLPTSMSPGVSSTTSISSTHTTLRTRSTPLTTPNAATSPVTSSSSSPLPGDDEREDDDMAPVLWMERFHISVTWLALVISTALLITFILIESLEFSTTFKALSFSYHFIWTILLIVSSIFMAYAAMEIDRQVCKVRAFEDRESCQKYLQKIISAAAGLLAAVIHGAISYLLISSNLYVQV